MVAGTAQELDAWLACPVAEMRRLECAAFDRSARGRPLVLMGAGQLGRRTLAGLRSDGVEPLAFADNSPALQGTTIDGVPVWSPRDAAQRFGQSAAFVVTIWGANSPHRFAHSRAQLASLGCDVVSSFPALYWKHSQALLPFYLQDLPSRVLEQATDVRRAFDLWEDTASRREYLSQVRLRLQSDFDGLSSPVQHLQYFPSDLYTWSEDEWVVDGGAYDGDTLRVLIGIHGERFAQVLAAEPDPANFARLERSVAEFPALARSRIRCVQRALAERSGTLHLAVTGTASSHADATASAGAIAVEAETLDSLVGDAAPTLVKLDIEGGELSALEGGRATIDRHMPVLAVCVYHRQDHLWNIPLFIGDRWRDRYAFYLRPHNEEGWDLVCYAVPRRRLRRIDR